MARQLAFELPHRTARGRGDYFVSDSNRAALAAVDAWRDWPAGKLVLVGPAGAGKSHLAALWAEESGARVLTGAGLAEVDPADYAGRAVAVDGAAAVAGVPAREQALFHLHNMVLAEGGRLLVTARAAPAQWRLGLPDLASRMAGASLVRIDAPDDALLTAVLVKLFADRQVQLSPRALAAIGLRVERSFAAVAEAVARLDAAALAAGRPVTAPLVRSVLGAATDR